MHTHPFALPLALVFHHLSILFIVSLVSLARAASEKLNNVEMRLEIHRLADIRRKNCLNLAHNIQYFLLKLGSLGNLLVISELYMDIIMHDGCCYDNVIIHFAIFV